MAKLTVFIVDSGSGAFWQIAQGWFNALLKAGHQPVMWNGDWKTWHHFEPDIYIGCSGHRREPCDDKAKVAIHVNPYCDEVIQVPGGPIINESQDAIKWTLNQKPKLVFGYGLQDDMNRWWAHWTNKHGIPTIGMPNAADVTRYFPRGMAVDKFKCDIGWVGGYWAYKGQNIDKYLLPIVKKYKTLWYGWSGPAGLWQGQINDGDVNWLFNSAKVCPAIVEPHTTKYGIDIPERIFKVAACGALTLSDPFWGYERYFKPESIPMASSPAEYAAMMENHLAATDEARRTRASELRSQVLTKHTYYHRVQVLLKALGYTQEASEYDTIIAALR
jgi:hypothetical protein